MTDNRNELRERLCDAVKIGNYFDAAALADEMFTTIIATLKRVLGRSTLELEAMLGDLRFDIERRIKTATRGTVSLAAVIDDIVTELMGSAHRG